MAGPDQTEKIITIGNEDHKNNAVNIEEPRVSYRADLSLKKPTGASQNLLLEGDNLIWLSLLRDKYKGVIDLIYIDPPYNTGNTDFLYNDKFTDDKSSENHSQWVSFMSSRLRIARELLAEDGLILVSIDDREQASLKLLMEDIFGADNFYGQFVQLRGNSTPDTMTVQRNHEYIICYSNGAKNLLVKEIIDHKKKQFENDFFPYSSDDDNENDHNEFYIEGTNPGSFGRHNKLLNAPGAGYTVYFLDDIDGTEELNRINMKIAELGYGGYVPMRSKDGKTFQIAIAIRDYDIDSVTLDSKESIYHDVKALLDLGFITIRPPKRKQRYLGCWSWSLQRFQEYWNNGEVAIKNKKNGGKRIIRKNFSVKAVKKIPIESVITITNKEGTQQLQEILPGSLFDYPKNVDLIKYFLSYYVNKNAVVLDFFAGSGTTAQAVMEMNIEDGGNRRFIICTNNEGGELNELNGICRKVTKPRIDTVITGIRPDGSKYSDGIDAGYDYYQIASE